MSNFDRDRSGGRSGGGFGWGRDRGWRDFWGWRGRSEMFSVVCDDCGRNCEVPFKPTWDRPVYCSDCFGGGDSRWGRDDRNDRGRGRDDRGRWRDEEKRMYSATCDQCGNDCELPFKPSSDKPVFCSDCFVKEEKPKRGGADYKADFDALNSKLDLIMKALNISEEKKEAVKIKLTKDLKKVESEDDSGDSFDEIKEDIFPSDDEIAEVKVKKAAKKAA
ncbi:MAG: hypothetical protein ACD_3C00054G0026 [uncultured bacterium (gcode 4)]|uniref:CxxC-x17-CxxC domain-containing protein n=1 Tax=uncultured bacterium (gcode 4) TaxID=1234023 RepID=K2FBI0_9BACT|nr:MAG: hypothetical protein ACD_3C00054G0026 [uncultured bacterium (gcode 4)]